MATAAKNIARGLEHLGIANLVTITRADEDRVWGWPTLLLELFCKGAGWVTDPKFAAEHEHGEGSRSYREPSGCHPAMQIVFHPCAAGSFVEIDFDYAAPVDVVSDIIHAGEVIGHAITRGKTNQDTISKMLDRRFGKVA